MNTKYMFIIKWDYVTHSDHVIINNDDVQCGCGRRCRWPRRTWGLWLTTCHHTLFARAWLATWRRKAYRGRQSLCGAGGIACVLCACMQADLQCSRDDGRGFFAWLQDVVNGAASRSHHPSPGHHHHGLRLCGFTYGVTYGGVDSCLMSGN